MAYSDLGKRVKQKYPGQYDDLSDEQVGQKVAAKYPGVYDDIVGGAVAGASTDTPAGPQKSRVEKVSDFVGTTGLAKGVSQGVAANLFGGQVKKQQDQAVQSNNQIQSAIQTIRNKFKGQKLTPEAQQQVLKLLDLQGNPFQENNLQNIATGGEEYQTPGQVIGSALQTGSNVLAGGMLKGAKAATVAKGAGQKAARFAGRAGYNAGLAGAYTGGQTLQEGGGVADAVRSGLRGAATGAAFTAGIEGGVQASKAVGAGVRQVLGKTTGSGAEAIKTAANRPSKAFLEAMRGKREPQDVLETAQEALETVREKQQAAYLAKIKQVKDSAVKLDKKAIDQSVNETLEKFRISRGGKKGLQFSSLSPITDAGERNKIKNIIEAYKSLPNTSVESLDALKQVIDNQYSVNDSARTKSIITAIGQSIRKQLNTVPGYQSATREYGKTAELLRDVSQALGVNDKKAKQTAFAKLSSALRDNQSLRKDVLEQLDSAAGSDIKGELAGAALSDWTPRGLSGAVAGSIGTGAAVIDPTLLTAAPLFSPRLVGEVAAKYGQGRALLSKADPLRDALIRQIMMRSSAAMNR